MIEMEGRPTCMDISEKEKQSDVKITSIQGLPTIYLETEDNKDSSKYKRRVIQVSGISLTEAEATLYRIAERFKDESK